MDNVALKTGIKGRFEVSLDDHLLFSKAKLKRFPEKDELLKLAEPMLGPPLNWR
jgi:selT/selW/selH-like putative selenoprotein